MRAGDLYPQATSDIVYDTWVNVYDYTFSVTATSLTISGLTGDTAKEYKLEVRIVNGYDGSIAVKVRPNNDDGADHYGHQYVDGTNITASAGRDVDYNAFYLCGAGALNNLAQGEITIQAKSGYIRTAISNNADTISTTTVSEVTLYGQSWNNTANGITSLVVLTDQAGGFGIGSNIVLWQRNYGI